MRHDGESAIELEIARRVTQEWMQNTPRVVAYRVLQRNKNLPKEVRKSYERTLKSGIPQGLRSSTLNRTTR